MVYASLTWRLIHVHWIKLLELSSRQLRQRNCELISTACAHFCHRICRKFHPILRSLLLDYCSTHYCDVITSAMASRITSLSVVYSTVCPGEDHRKHQSSVSLAFEENSPVTGKFPPQRASNAKMFLFDDVIIHRMQPNCQKPLHEALFTNVIWVHNWHLIYFPEILIRSIWSSQNLHMSRQLSCDMWE